jgi:hypothetical protein
MRRDRRDKLTEWAELAMMRAARAGDSQSVRLIFWWAAGKLMRSDAHYRRIFDAAQIAECILSEQ